MRNNIKSNSLGQLFWFEFVIMSGVLLLIVAMTLVGVQKVHQVNADNEIQIEASLTLQNVMEYCKIHSGNIEVSLQELGATIVEERENYLKLALYYDEDWRNGVPRQNATHSVEIQIDTLEYTYGTLKNIILEGYEMEHYNIAQHGTNGNGKKLSLTLEGNCIVGEGENISEGQN
ncbi:MAG: hypothetical protein J6F30_04765 [Cellulosilyticum sp.]|nr:hypothetical protein [Cellulosilyticum sp.]